VELPTPINVTDLSKDVRSSLFTQPTSYVPTRVGQIGIRTTF